MLCHFNFKKKNTAQISNIDFTIASGFRRAG